MKILALDQSASNTGFVLGNTRGPVVINSFGVSKSSWGNNYGRLLIEYADKVWPLIEQADWVYYEEPIVVRSDPNLNTMMQLYSIAAHIEFLCMHAGKGFTRVPNGAHKKIIYDHGGAKPQNACQYASSWGFRTKNSDEADACGVFLYALKENFRDDFNAWFRIKRDSKHVSRITKPNSGRRKPPSKTTTQKRDNVLPSLI